VPELPEVETVARGLAAALVGAEIGPLAIARADWVRIEGGDAVRELPGRRIVGVVRHGKRLEILVEPEGAIQIHLGMTGNAGVRAPDSPAEPHTHLRMGLRGRPLELRIRDPRRFGGVRIRLGPERGCRARNFAPLGPDALRIRWPAFRRLLERRTGIKALLLDQRRIAGLGNIYADEILHAAGLHPATPAARLSEEDGRRLLDRLRRILRRAIRAGGSTLRDYRSAEGRPGTYQRRHRVYGREGRPCPTCGTGIVREIVAGRSTRLCPRCQPLDRFTFDEENQSGS
jgi:formamidopyrimidine-DNA glycosylase